MELPKLGGAKFLILAAVVDGPKTPAEIRRWTGWDKAQPYFTRRLTRLQQRGLVRKIGAEGPGRGKRRVEITDAGRRAWSETVDWYLYVAERIAADPRAADAET